MYISGVRKIDCENAEEQKFLENKKNEMESLIDYMEKERFKMIGDQVHLILEDMKILQ